MVKGWGWHPPLRKRHPRVESCDGASLTGEGLQRVPLGMDDGTQRPMG